VVGFLTRLGQAYELRTFVVGVIVKDDEICGVEIVRDPLYSLTRQS
jgi:hypothetical protein